MSGASVKIAVIGAASGGSPPLCRCAGPASTSTSTSRRRARPRSAAYRHGPDAVRILYRLGWPTARPRGCSPYRLASTALGGLRHVAAGTAQPAVRTAYRAPHLTMHRADLLALIALGFRSSVSISAIASSASPSWRRRPRAVRQWRAHRGRCAGRCRRHRFHNADGAVGEEAPRFAGCVAYRGPCRVNASPISTSKSARNPGSDPATISCTTSCHAAGC